VVDFSNIEFDVIVIGAGINGAGIARDAALRGLRVLLLDKGDIGGGTSSWSTRLIHGGLRYLEHGELRLVRESLREREILLKIAGHLVKPLPILIPIYQNSKRGMGTVRAGMVAYDLLSFDKTLPRQRMLSHAETINEAPGLNSNGLLGAAVYYDAQVEFAERLVLENVLAAHNRGATVTTYARVRNLVIGNGNVRAVQFELAPGGESHVAQGRLIVNASGPWVDQLLDQKNVKIERLIGGTKGSHIIVAPFHGAPASAVYVEAETDRRPFFIIPWNGHYLIGTTDIRYDGDLDRVAIERDEIDYLLNETNRVFAGAKLTRNQILYTYAGVRPLPFSAGKNERSITRRHFVREHPQLKNLLSIVGGKLTTYRSLAEQCVDQLFHKLGKQTPPCTTASLPLPGAIDCRAAADEFRKQSRFSSAVNKRLLRIYGARANEVAQFCAREETFSRSFNKAGDALAGEVVFSFERELARTLTDCLLRRTMIGLNADLAIGDDEIAVEICKAFLGWNDERVSSELANYRSDVDRMRVNRTKFATD
jgi:glycerol-3-phosphate dehydrogenase